MRTVVLSLIVFFMFGITAVKGEQNMISEGKTVKFHYTLTVKGEVVDTSEGKDPLEYVHGSQSIIPGLEAQLEGLKVGDTKSVIVGPEDAYGPVDPRAYVDIPKSNLPADMDPQVGMQLQVQTQAGQPLVGIIEEINEDTLKVNFNHPLAGQELKFDVTIVDIQ